MACPFLANPVPLLVSFFLINHKPRPQRPIKANCFPDHGPRPLPWIFVYAGTGLQTVCLPKKQASYKSSSLGSAAVAKAQGSQHSRLLSMLRHASQYCPSTFSCCYPESYQIHNSADLAIGEPNHIFTSR